MNLLKSVFINKIDLVFTIILLVTLTQQSYSEIRNWTNTKGTEIQADLLSYDGTTAKLSMNGQDYNVPKEKLSQADQEFLKNWLIEKNTRPTGRINNFAIHTKLFKKPKDYFEGNVRKAAYKFYKDKKTADSLDDAVSSPEKLIGYSTSEETASLYIPDNYNDDATAQYGLYIHISPGKKGGIPGGYESTFDKHRIIAISPHDAGNNRSDLRRMALALDCMASIKKDYRIDKSRVYIGGLSGGGILSFYTALLYPEYFTAAISHARGVNLDQRPSSGGRFWRVEVPYLDNNDLKKVARLKGKWIFVSGPKDFNHEHIVAEIPQWEKRGFNVKFFDVPGMGHSNAPANVFAEIIQWVEST